MDPLGFALENFDAIGEWRAEDRYAGDADRRVRHSCRRHAGATARPTCARRCSKRPEQFVQTLTEKLMTYALGRSVEYYDMPTVRADRPRRGARQLPLLVDRDGHREERRRSRCEGAGAGAASTTTASDDDDRQTVARAIGRRRIMFITKKHLSRRTVLRGARRRRRPAAARRDDPGVDGAGADRRAAEAAHGVHVPPARRDHGALDAGRRRAQSFELTPILKPLAPFQKQLTIVSGLENKPAIAPPVHALIPGTWLSCVTPRGEPGAATAASRSTRSRRSTSARTRRCRRSKSRPKAAAAAARATATTAAATARRSRSARRRRRCRWSPIRASCSSSCSARATRAQERKAIAEAVRAACSTCVHARGRRPAAHARRRGSRELGDYLESVREIERRVQKMEAQDLSSARPARRAGRQPTLRSAAQADVRHDRAGVSGEPHARRSPS